MRLCAGAQQAELPQLYRAPYPSPGRRLRPRPAGSTIERIEVASLEQHDLDLASPEGVALRAELYGRFLDRARNIYFTADAIE